jgi:hypothetical protein
MRVSNDEIIMKAMPKLPSLIDYDVDQQIIGVRLNEVYYSAGSPWPTYVEVVYFVMFCRAYNRFTKEPVWKLESIDRQVANV